MFLSRLPFRLIRQSWTKSYSTVSVNQVEAMKKETVFHSVHLTDNDIANVAPPRYPLSSARLNVSKGPSIKFAELAPSLFEFLKTVTTNGRRDDEPKWEAFEVLENALQVLTSNESSSELTSGLTDTLDLLLSQRNTEGAVNHAIVNLILKHLTRDHFVLNKSHSKVFEPSKRIFLPEALKWDGLALGHRDAWYGELDMLIFPSNTGEARPRVALLGEKCGGDPPFDEGPEQSVLEQSTVGRSSSGWTASTSSSSRRGRTGRPRKR